MPCGCGYSKHNLGFYTIFLYKRNLVLGLICAMWYLPVVKLKATIRNYTEKQGFFLDRPMFI